jgi:hypothetical protein
LNKKYQFQRRGEGPGGILQLKGLNHTLAKLP